MLRSRAHVERNCKRLIEMAAHLDRSKKTNDDGRSTLFVCHIAGLLYNLLHPSLCSYTFTYCDNRKQQHRSTLRSAPRTYIPVFRAGGTVACADWSVLHTGAQTTKFFAGASLCFLFDPRDRLESKSRAPFNKNIKTMALHC